MKMKKRNKALFGYVQFEGLGGFQEKFLNKLISDDIQLYEVKQESALVSAIIRTSDYLYASRTAKRYGVRLKAKKRIGLYHRLYNYRKRWGIAIGLLCCGAVLTILSQFVWDVRISGNENVSNGEITRAMQDCGVMPGAGKHSFDSRVCELKIMNMISELSWISVEREGSRVYVKIGETMQDDKPEIEYDTPCNIISDIDGQLVSAQIKRGLAQTQIGSGIRKGQLLVSGTVNDNGGHIVYVHSEAELTAQYTHTEEFRLDFRQKEKIPEGHTYTSSYLMFGDYSVALPWDSYRAESMDNFRYSEDINNINILGLTLPFRYKKGTYTQYTEKEVQYTNRDIIDKLNKQQKDYETNFLSDCKIISSKTDFFPDENGITLKAEYLLEKNIGVKQPITLFY